MDVLERNMHMFYIILISVISYSSGGKLQASYVPELGYHHSKWGTVIERVGYLAVAAITRLPGTIIVIGANTGSVANDPIWHVLSGTSKSATFEVVMVEPIPCFHKILAENMKTIGLKNSVAVNAAITSLGEGITLYCTGMHLNGTVVDGFPGYVSQMCSGSPDALYTLFKPDDKHGQSLVKKYMQKYVVAGISPKDLILRYVRRSPVTMVQIDVEGFDDKVVQRDACQFMWYM